MKYIIKPTNQFKKDFKKIKKQNKDLNILKKVIDMLANDEILPDKYRDHLLIGNYKGKHECHLEPDWLLIYEYLEDELILFLTRTGSHSDLFLQKSRVLKIPCFYCIKKTPYKCTVLKAVIKLVSCVRKQSKVTSTLDSNCKLTLMSCASTCYTARKNLSSF